MKSTEAAGIAGGCVLVWLLIVLLLLYPLAVIWAVNTLFGTEIAFTWTNWLATLVLTGVFKSTNNIKTKS